MSLTLCIKSSTLVIHILNIDQKRTEFVSYSKERPEFISYATGIHINLEQTSRHTRREFTSYVNRIHFAFLMNGLRGMWEGNSVRIPPIPFYVKFTPDFYNISMNIISYIRDHIIPRTSYPIPSFLSTTLTPLPYTYIYILIQSFIMCFSFTLYLALSKYILSMIIGFLLYLFTQPTQNIHVIQYDGTFLLFNSMSSYMLFLVVPVCSQRLVCCFVCNGIVICIVFVRIVPGLLRFIYLTFTHIYKV